MATRKKRLTDDEIKALCESEITTASGWYAGELAEERADAMDRYLGEPQGDEQEGRSQFRTREVLDTVEAVMPSLARIFMDADNICAFEPVGPEDEESAEQESDLVQQAFWKENQGFFNLYNFLKDALLSKTGVLKVWWDDTPEESREEYEGLNDWELAQLFSDKTVEREVLEYEATEEGHNITLLTTRASGKIQIMPCPPEEFGVDRDSRSIYPEESNFVYHRVRKTKSDLVEEGYDKKTVMELPSADDVETEERLARRHLTDEQEFMRQGEHWSMTRVWVTESYLRVDRDGDGISELLKVTLAGSENGYSAGATLMDIEEVDRVPFVVWSPVILTHKFYGLSLADLVSDIQIIKTSLTRQILDNTYLSNNGRTAINERVNIDDMLTSRPGGIVRVEGEDPPANSIMPWQHPQVPDQAFGLLEYLDELRKARTGVGDDTGVLDPKALASVNTGVAALAYDQARARIEMMARIRAEVGLRPLFLRIHELLRKHSDKEKVVRLRGQWVPVNPTHWRERTDMSVRVGIGNVSRERRLVALSDVLDKQQLAIQEAPWAHC